MVILFDQYHLPDDVLEIIFATEQQVMVARMLLTEFKEAGGSLGKTEMSVFANRLHEGTTIEIDESVGPISQKKTIKISYNKRQFYDRILTPMKSMGLVDYDMYKKQYRISDNFIHALKKIGLMWQKELQTLQS
jgi:hypothetical protein